jgi:hypothetical protein
MRAAFKFRWRSGTSSMNRNPWFPSETIGGRFAFYAQVLWGRTNLIDWNEPVRGPAAKKNTRD